MWVARMGHKQECLPVNLVRRGTGDSKQRVLPVLAQLLPATEPDARNNIVPLLGKVKYTSSTIAS